MSSLSPLPQSLQDLEQDQQQRLLLAGIRNTKTQLEQALKNFKQQDELGPLVEKLVGLCCPLTDKYPVIRLSHLLVNNCQVSHLRDMDIL